MNKENDSINYNPDVLNCLANLSNDEVFTPPAVANQMLDLLPKEIWSNADATFLDPVCKTGVFLREITKRLIIGLADKIPDLQERVNHILTKQVFGIAITELTGYLSRRSTYCSKTANGKYSICDKFDDEQGNIHFNPCQHTWNGDRCAFCGASKAVYERETDLESHAYKFIHTNNPKGIFNDMNFDVIIGNPPYQLDDGGDTEERRRGGATPLYHKFVEKAKMINPHFLIMIIPSRWFAGGRGLDNFRDVMLKDKRLECIVDYPIASDCFPGIQLKGGACYFLWNRDYHGECEIKTIRNDKISIMKRPLLEKGCDTLIRYNEAIPILRKVLNFNEQTMDKLVSPEKPFGLRTFIKGEENYFDNAVKLYANKSVGYISRSSITLNADWIDKYKIYISMAYGAGEDFPHQILNKPFIGEPNTCCTETYIVIGTYQNKENAENALSYICTRFFRFMVLLKKNTQHAPAGVYSLVPIQDFTESWTDEKLYKKYGLTEDEIAFIESMIRPMDAADSSNINQEEE
ncbi:MAG: Eco57I restriction-modification methylase domain-containing protein [Muribaculaceae bacterium]|jgi:site-specific DNA-methyltransferase (adenine-specific)|nr:Eco57I restriction-modification methylase domain-containing protein [Muribaculaceae bacterium]